MGGEYLFMLNYHVYSNVDKSPELYTFLVISPKDSFCAQPQIWGFDVANACLGICGRIVGGWEGNSNLAF
jgi:hypothetical protein